ncbi:hypothetical protein [Sphingobium aquiterrae]|uniref:hypothetical protein n=1 Tax=Sphingobium aquiterrae TaxID=2038656 RepID=UPI00301975EA
MMEGSPETQMRDSKSEDEGHRQSASFFVAKHGRKAPQRIVDQMQAAIRGGHDAKAAELERILRMIEDHLEGSRQ